MDSAIAIAVGLGMSAVVLAGIAIIFAGMAWAKVVGMEKSTHQIQYVPIDPAAERDKAQELEKAFEAAWGESATEEDYV